MATLKSLRDGTEQIHFQIDYDWGGVDDHLYGLMSDDYDQLHQSIINIISKYPVQDDGYKKGSKSQVSEIDLFEIKKAIKPSQRFKYKGEVYEFTEFFGELDMEVECSFEVGFVDAREDGILLEFGPITMYNHSISSSGEHYDADELDYVVSDIIADYLNYQSFEVYDDLDGDYVDFSHLESKLKVELDKQKNDLLRKVEQIKDRMVKELESLG